MDWETTIRSDPYYGGPSFLDRMAYTMKSARAVSHKSGGLAHGSQT